MTGKPQDFSNNTDDLEEDTLPTSGLSPDLTGTQIAYYAYCVRKLWLFSHHITMERDSDLVALGRQIHKTSYCDERKELSIDNKIVIDILAADKVVTEVKLSSRMRRVDELQIKYYLYYLKSKGVTNVAGELRYPKERRRQTITLSLEDEQELTNIITRATVIIQQNKPPTPFAEACGRCRRCSYQEFCWA